MGIVFVLVRRNLILKCTAHLAVLYCVCVGVSAHEETLSTVTRVWEQAQVACLHSKSLALLSPLAVL